MERNTGLHPHPCHTLLISGPQFPFSAVVRHRLLPAVTLRLYERPAPFLGPPSASSPLRNTSHPSQLPSGERCSRQPVQSEPDAGSHTGPSLSLDPSYQANLRSYVLLKSISRLSPGTSLASPHLLAPEAGTESAATCALTPHSGTVIFPIMSLTREVSPNPQCAMPCHQLPGWLFYPLSPAPCSGLFLRSGTLHLLFLLLFTQLILTCPLGSTSSSRKPSLTLQTRPGSLSVQLITPGTSPQGPLAQL